ncbi:MAG: hypothetical protein LZF86_10083 [Nitrospira sp.]|nr:MAG: hypothetical protein LZF86_10083 [Nitrospira sp.]
MKISPTNTPCQVLRLWIALLIVLTILPLSGCVAQQADLKQTERALQQKLKQQDDQLSQARARQSQGISILREQELPQLRGQLEQALHQIQDLRAQIDSLTPRSKKNLSSEVDELGTSSKNVEARLDSHDELLSSILFQLAELTKQVKALEKR